jgi:hypothetical protein
MALEQRIQSLRKRHADIEIRLHDEESRPRPDAMQLHRWKCEKLFLKDEMSRLSGSDQQAA